MEVEGVSYRVHCMYPHTVYWSLSLRWIRWNRGYLWFANQSIPQRVLDSYQAQPRDGYFAWSDLYTSATESVACMGQGVTRTVPLFVLASVQTKDWRCSPRVASMTAAQ